jgi:YHS domain-containing protein
MMRTVFSFAAAAALALGIVSPSLAFPETAKAHPTAMKAAKPAKAVKCPVCGMALSTKKTKANPQAVKIKGKTYYCCSACKMDTAAKGAGKS